MKKLLFSMVLLPLLMTTYAQEELVKWTFSNNQLGDTVQNGSNALNLTCVIRVERAESITIHHGHTPYAEAIPVPTRDEG